MSTGVKEVVKTGRQRPYALSIFSPMLSSPGGPGGGGVAGSVHPGRRCSFVVPVAEPVGPKLVWSEAVAAGKKLRGGCWEPSLSAEDGWNLQRIPKRRGELSATGQS